MGRLFRRIAAAVLPAALIVVVAGPAGAASLADDPVQLGMRDLAPGKDKHPSGMAEAFRYTAAGDGPVDVINVYVERAGRKTKLHAGIYTDHKGRPSELLGDSDEPTSDLDERDWNSVGISPVDLDKGETYWIAVLGYDGELTLRNFHDSKGGTSDSVTAKGKLKSLKRRWETAAVWKKIGPASVYAADSYRVLVFTKGSTGNAAEGVAALRSLPDADEVIFDVTDDASKFTEENLAKYRAVVFLNTSGDVLDDAQQGAFEEYYRGGGGFFGIGSAIETEPDWQFLTDVLGARATPTGGKTAVQAGTIKVADRVHDASKNLPEYWTRTDAWYNFDTSLGRPPIRGLNHVLATVVEHVDDRGAFEIQPWGGRLEGIEDGTMGADHPVTWCKDFRGGRSFYTALGNTAASFGEEDFRDQLAGAVRWAAGQSDPVYSDCGATVLANYQQTKVSGPPNLSEPIGFDVLPDARVIQTDRRGGVRLHDPVTNSTTLLANIPVYTVNEDGMYGPAIDNGFAENKWVYLFYSPPTVKDVKLSDGSVVTQTTPLTAAPNTGASYSVWDPWVGYFQLSRFKFVDETATEPAHLDLASEQEILRVPNNRGACCHVAGDIDFDKHNNLWMVTGDDTPAGGGNSGGFGPFNDMKTNETQTVRDDERDRRHVHADVQRSDDRRRSRSTRRPRPSRRRSRGSATSSPATSWPPADR